MELSYHLKAFALLLCELKHKNYMEGDGGAEELPSPYGNRVNSISLVCLVETNNI